MKDLHKMIQAEVSKGKYLRRTLEDGQFPSEEVAKEIGKEELFKLASNTLEFIININLEILVSDYRLIGLMEAYISNSKSLGRNGSEISSMQESIPQYKSECKSIMSYLVREVMKGQ